MAARAARLALLLALALPACVQDDGRRWNPVRAPFEKTESEERELGFRFDQEAQTQLPLIDDLRVLEFVDALGRVLLEQVGPQPFLYRFRVIRDPALNAFAVPGGFVYLHTGTLLAAGSINELAGVMAHEIAHVKGRHYARMVEQAAVPNLLTSAAGVLAAVATGEPGLAVTAQAVNVALQLRYSRTFEGEADRLGASFMSRAGYDPEGMVRFFERIVLEKRSAPPTRLPPYLYSHPDVEERIQTVSELATQLRPRQPHPPDLGSSLADVQARISFLVDRSRSTWDATEPFDRAAGDTALARAEGLAGGGDRDAALALLAQAETESPSDPRLPFRRAGWLEEAERLPEAANAYRRTLELDPSRALVFLRLGLVHKRLGNPSRAVFYLEQAVRRSAPTGGLRERARWEVEKLSFPVIAASGLADGSTSSAADTVAGVSRERFGPDDPRAVWWGRLNSHFADRREALVARWIGPDSRVAQEGPVERAGRVYARSILPLRGRDVRSGDWVVEVRFDEDLVDRQRFRVEP